LKFILSILLLGVSMWVSADSDGAFAGVSLGHTELEIQRSFDGNSEAIGASGLGLSLGYVFDFQMTAELGAMAAKRFSFFGATDRYSLRHLEALLGYRLTWDQWSLTPKAGYADWELRAREGQLFNPGSEASQKRAGDNSIWGLEAGYRVNPDIQLAMHYKRINTRFGEYEITHLAMYFEL